MAFPPAMTYAKARQIIDDHTKRDCSGNLKALGENVMVTVETVIILEKL